MNEISLHELALERVVREASDAHFDVMLPAEWRAWSPRFWTPVDVAVRAAAWFHEAQVGPVLDVGSGIGKLCTIGALASPIEFVGIEHRASLVDVARQVADVLHVSDRARFVHASIDTFDASAFKAFYLFNPFGENLYTRDEQLDSTVELSVARYDRDVQAVEMILRRAPIGSRVITYHGFGGRMPNCYAPERVKTIGSDFLRLWVKRREVSTGHYIEMGATHLGICGAEAENDGASGR